MFVHPTQQIQRQLLTSRKDIGRLTFLVEGHEVYKGYISAFSIVIRYQYNSFYIYFTDKEA